MSPTEVSKPTRMVAFFGMSTKLGVSYQERNKKQGTRNISSKTGANKRRLGVVHSDKLHAL